MANKHRILLVDDDRESTELLCRRLLRSGFEVTELNHPRQALEAASLRDFDVAVLDRSLPEIDGVRLMQMLRGHNADLQVVFLSGHDDPEKKTDALSCGAFAYLTKPCRMAEIVATVERAIEDRCDALHAGSTEQTAKEPTEINNG